MPQASGELDMAPVPSVQGYIGKIPQELRLQVCELLPGQALKNLGLANKRWRKSSSTVLWKTFSSHLQERGRDFDALLLSPPNGFLDNVKNLKITSFDVSEKVLQLIAVLAQNTLRTVELPTGNPRILGLLIRSQNLIEELTYQHPGLQHSRPDSRFLVGNLNKLRKLTITPAKDDDFNAWLLNTPALETLNIAHYNGFKPSNPELRDLASLKRWKCPSTFIPLRLRHLRLSYLNLFDGPYHLGKITDLQSLTDLEISYCINVSSFLEHLSIEYSALDSFALKSLCFTQSFEEPDLFKFLNQFIGCFSGLERLFVATRNPQHVNVEKMCRHGQTLRLLHLDPLYRPSRLPLSEARNHCYTATELETLLVGCPKIQELGVHVAAIDIRSMTCGVPYLFPQEQNFAKALDVIARFPLLRSLRLTHLLATWSNVEFGNPVERAVQYSQLATEVLQYLAARSSPIEIYANSPTVTPGYLDMAKDFQGHQWPHYYYVRGLMTLPSRGRTHTEIVAVPVKGENMAGYLPKQTILLRNEPTDEVIW
ncbi:uncharacterized protein J4E88_009473 [Alternaria novae-zelandiae]|uniref:uncharacterized protein n=1 Tax=Alternaria novae-zelandiae TaxID=430562 RepID=UPI0020C2AAFD|nr:uncharacterized protein J4E88_009473 [Alternaria novae-zelandiae]XP_051348309.1 uncharacterized protein J4E92_010183 [Alternaria infectoria]KAI4671075.1 hypothetical protein J4E88_009473 [Alternaria novae-zelandiae]KAI4912138.1 hypothetical protein J4E92_010183 [Alternaria infectoria]